MDAGVKYKVKCYKLRVTGLDAYLKFKVKSIKLLAGVRTVLIALAM